MNCYAKHGEPCKCRRVTGTCTRCRRDVTVSHGERAPKLDLDSPGTLASYVCLRCR